MRYLALLLAFTLHACCTVVQAQTYIKGPALIEGYSEVVTSGGTTTLTKDSQTNQFFSGTSAHTVVMAAANTLPLGRYVVVQNKSTQDLTVNASGGGFLATVPADSQSKFTVTDITTAAGVWNVSSSSGGIVGIVGVDQGGTGIDASAAPNGSLLIGNGTGFTLDTLDGTTNQVNITNGAGSITLSLPQDIHTAATPQFADVELLGANYTDYFLGRSLAQQMTTGLVKGALLTVNANPALMDIAAGDYTFMDYSGDALNPIVKSVSCSAQAGITLTNLATATTTYISMSPSCVVLQQTTLPTAAQRRTNAFVGRVAHANNTSITSIRNTPDFVVDVTSQVYDFFDALGAFNVSGNKLSANGANLSFNKSSGRLFRRSANYQTSDQDPHVVTLSATSPSSFRYATSSTVVGSLVTTISPGNYDVGGTVTAIPGANSRASVQRVFLFSTGDTIVQYGPNWYANMSEAIAAIPTESFVINPTAADGGVLIGYIVCRKDATLLNDPAQCAILNSGRFDSGSSGAATSTTTLQGAYLNSVQPQITLNATQSGVQIRDDATPIGVSLFAVQNNAASTSYLGVDTTGISATGFTGTGTTGAVRLHNLTTTQRNALTGAAGMMVYDTTLGQFFCYGTAWGPCGSKSLSTQTPTGFGNLTIDLTADVQRIRLTPSSAVTLSATPFGSSAPKDGAEIILIGTNDTNTVTIPANDAANGVVGYSKTLGRGNTIRYIWSQTDSRYYILSTGN